MSDESSPRELRWYVRQLRRGRRTVNLVDAVSDAYIAVLATLLLGSMLVSVVVNVRRTAAQACLTEGCLAARGALPWLAGLAVVLVVVMGARLFGPAFVSPAEASWMLTSPADRGALLRPGLLRTAGLGTLLAAGVAAVAAALGGLAAPAVAPFAGAVALLALLGVLLAARAQEREDRSAAALTWLLAAGVWVAFLAVSTEPAALRAPSSQAATWTVTDLVLLAAVATLGLFVFRGLAGVRRQRLTAGGRLAPALSGALATLDLALAYDVLAVRRWRDHPPVRSRRGGPSGAAALVWLDLVRVLRSPRSVLVPLAAVVVPYAALAVGLGAAVPLVATVAGFLAVLPLCAALRVVTRTPALGRMLPFPGWVTRSATLVVPGLVCLVTGLATAPALAAEVAAATRAPGPAVLAGLAVGAATLASAARWMTGRPPDYAGPLVSSPAGAVPTNLYGSAARGFDVALLTSVPLLLSTSTGAAELSLALSGVVLTWVTHR